MLRLLHLIGFHKWKTFKTGSCKMKMYANSVFSGTQIIDDVDTTIKLQYCTTCENRRALVSTAFYKSTYDFDTMRSGLELDNDDVRILIEQDKLQRILKIGGIQTAI